MITITIWILYLNKLTFDHKRRVPSSFYTRLTPLQPALVKSVGHGSMVGASPQSVNDPNSTEVECSQKSRDLNETKTVYFCFPHNKNQIKLSLLLE